MESFELGFEWWTLLGEPLEIYHFRWKASDSDTINNKTCKRADLVKYPDLLKRYDNYLLSQKLVYLVEEA